ncbi:MAG: hypothetical protein WAK13_19970 [Terriglobales bacterium]
MHYIFYGMAEESGAHLSELLCGVRSEKLQARGRATFGFDGRCQRRNLQFSRYIMSRGFGGIDDCDVDWSGSA